ncbi:cupin domain-containing protein [Phyllobacterium sp. YR531]|uniref:cupin domain-containing protein n=1 Tax=Phyllobacterium sp. YR531 TaxID=1144343 RepID=UPI00026F7E7B|nr:cupin domain-containing protein [Phyllobacterium sp. YR531]EJN02100.1 hypothetical protein PMI41_02851 [Phyllobacterium sp. YR531]
MNTTIRIATAILVFSIGIPISLSHAQQQALLRTDLVQQDLGKTGQKVVQVLVGFSPKASSIKHSHPGVEIAHVVGGTIEYELEGQKPVTLKAGGSLFIPAGVAHVAKNVGEVTASELATYIVTKGKQLVVPEE